MIKLFSSDEIRAAETAVKNAGVCEYTLIDRAATHLANRVKGDNIICVCGGGGNGCDGLSAAIILKKGGKNVRVYALLQKSEICADYIQKAQALGISVENFTPDTNLDCDTLIDAIFGIGLNRNVTGIARQAIESINKANAFVLSADMPSGVNSDSGEICGACVRADKTVTFSAYKGGLIFSSGLDCAGEVEVCQVGIDLDESDIYVVEDTDAVLPKRESSTHKGSYGRAAIIGGSPTMVGAPLIALESANACARSGAGLTVLCVPDSLKGAYQARVKECTLAFLPDLNGYIRFDKNALNEICKNKNVIAIGMGMGNNAELKDIIKYLEVFSGTLIVDADGLNAFAYDYLALKNAKGKLVITPHVGEFTRLTGLDANVENAKAVAKNLNAVVVLKSNYTIITDGTIVYINTIGSPAQAKGGSGDALAGAIAALSCVFSPLKAAYIACARLGLAALYTAKTRDEASVLVSDVIDNLGKPL